MINKKGFITYLFLILVGMLFAGGFLINGFSFNKEDGLSLPNPTERCKLNYLSENETCDFFCEENQKIAHFLQKNTSVFNTHTPLKQK